MPVWFEYVPSNSNIADGGSRQGVTDPVAKAAGFALSEGAWPAAWPDLHQYSPASWRAWWDDAYENMPSLSRIIVLSPSFLSSFLLPRSNAVK